MKPERDSNAAQWLGMASTMSTVAIAIATLLRTF
jgi:hypothetical protein